MEASQAFRECYKQCVSLPTYHSGVNACPSFRPFNFSQDEEYRQKWTLPEPLDSPLKSTLETREKLVLFHPWRNI